VTLLAAGKKIRRTVSLPWLEKPLNIEIASWGLAFWVQGSRKKATLTWTEAIRASVTPQDVPSYLMNKPCELMQHQAKKKS
jgi:hypothetical protein